MRCESQGRGSLVVRREDFGRMFNCSLGTHIYLNIVQWCWRSAALPEAVTAKVDQPGSAAVFIYICHIAPYVSYIATCSAVAAASLLLLPSAISTMAAVLVSAPAACSISVVLRQHEQPLCVCCMNVCCIIMKDRFVYAVCMYAVRGTQSCS